MAFKGNNLELFRSAIDEVNIITNNGGEVFPPTFPTWRRPESGTALQREPNSTFKGHLERDEAVAVRILLDECSALYQNFGVNDSTSRKISEVLNLPDGGWQTDVMDGIAEFGMLVGIAAGVRDKIEHNEPLPKAGTWGYRIDKEWRDTFEDAIKLDNFEISRNTVEAILKSISESAERDIPSNPEGAKGKEQIQARIDSRKHGAIKAKALYLEVKELAKKHLQ